MLPPPEDLLPKPRSLQQAVRLSWLLRRTRTNHSVKQSSLALLADLEVCVAARVQSHTLIMSALKRTPSDLLDLLARRPFMFMLAVLVISWLPLSFGPTLWTSDDEAQQFLGNLWQVEAAAFGLVIAAALFLFEAYSSSIRGKYGIGLRS